MDGAGALCHTSIMDVYFDFNGVSFAWNADKAESNSRKHNGVTFPQAAEACFNPQEQKYYEA